VSKRIKNRTILILTSVADKETFLQGEEGEYSEEENSKVELKSEANDAANSSAKEEKGEEKPETKGTVTGERQSGDGQVSTQHSRPLGIGMGLSMLEE
jgi:hypothetical protein